MQVVHPGVIGNISWKIELNLLSGLGAVSRARKVNIVTNRFSAILFAERNKNWQLNVEDYRISFHIFSMQI